MASSVTKNGKRTGTDGEERQPDVQLQDVLFRHWSLRYVLDHHPLLAIVGTYLIDWWLTHPGPYAAPGTIRGPPSPHLRG